MHIHIALAYALLVWWPQRPSDTPIGSSVQVESTYGTCAVVLLHLAIVTVLARLASSSSLRSMHSTPNGSHRAQQKYHRSLLALRVLLLASFAVDVTLTQWLNVAKTLPGVSLIPGLFSLVAVLPFVVGTVLMLTAFFPIDRAVRLCVCDTPDPAESSMGRGTWNLREYLSFNIRHQLLVVVVPMTLILCVYDLTDRFEDVIKRSLPIPWGPDVLLGIAAGLVFLIAPWLLKHIWTTHSLPPGPLRDSLQTMCENISLKCRDILVWRSGGMIVNAAVMGLIPPLRYVMLSDGMIDLLTPKQIEAVFGHEAGHVKHKHIQFFLLFALASMLLATGIVQLIVGPPPFRIDPLTAQTIGLASVILIWAAGFGFVSSRFERQADLFGARCVAPADVSQCSQPCSRHPDTDTASDQPEALCATGARIFTSALDRVAVLNGIPVNEFSWRHSSIANRIQFLDAASSDPQCVARFERLIKRIKATLLIVCVVGLAVSVYYVWPFVFGGQRIRLSL